MHDSFPTLSVRAPLLPWSRSGPHRHIVLVVHAPVAFPFVPEVRMSGRRRGETGWRNIVACAGGHAVTQRSVTSAPGDAGRRLPRLLSALPFLLEVRMRRSRQVAKRSVYARPDSPFSIRALSLPLSRSSSHVSGHVLVACPLPVVTASSTTRKAEVGECRNGGHILLALRCTRDMGCAALARFLGSPSGATSSWQHDPLLG
jgi:hypothetical protein